MDQETITYTPYASTIATRARARKRLLFSMVAICIHRWLCASGYWRAATIKPTHYPRLTLAEGLHGGQRHVSKARGIGISQFSRSRAHMRHYIDVLESPDYGIRVQPAPSSSARGYCPYARRRC
jgi:hypothetical protein